MTDAAMRVGTIEARRAMEAASHRRPYFFDALVILQLGTQRPMQKPFACATLQRFVQTASHDSRGFCCFCANAGEKEKANAIAVTSSTIFDILRLPQLQETLANVL
jgi:hypothetical protein